MGSIISMFAKHRVAPDLLMIIVFVIGSWSLSKINTQFFPTFQLQYISVSAKWPGASAEDIETSVIIPLENQLRTLSTLKEMTSSALDGIGFVYLEFPDKANISDLLDKAKQQVNLAVSNLPADVETPQVSEVVRYDDITRITISGDMAAGELRNLVRTFETELLGIGIGKVDVNGIPKEEIQVLVDDRRLIELGLTFGDIGEKIGLDNRDNSAGKLESGDSQYQLRTLSKREDIASLTRIPIKTLPDGTLIRLGDIATIERRHKENKDSVLFDGKPAVELHLRRNLSDNILDAAQAADSWMMSKEAELPPSINIAAHDKNWVAVQDRLQLLLKNGFLGLILVVSVLFILLSARVAFWIAVGIPIAFMMCLAVFGYLGGTINMISMFALIMATGIIVDDSIVVGENFLYRLENGENAIDASIGSAKRMFIPILASSLTTISSFIPLFVIGGIIGSIIFDIPFIIVCVITAALLECFLILPGHLYSSYRKQGYKEKNSGLRYKINANFNRFRDRMFRPLVQKAVEYRGTTVVACISMLALSIGLLVNGFVRYSFFPGADLNILNVNMEFVVGTPDRKMIKYVRYLEDSLPALEEELKIEGLVKHTSVYFGARTEQSEARRERVRMRVELAPGDKRKISLDEVADVWRSQITQSPEIETFVISGQRGGPPGSDIEFDIRGADIAQLKKAALELQERLRGTSGVLRISDDLPYGKQQLVFSLTPLSRQLGLNVNYVSSQLRDAYDGSLAQTFTEGVDEIEVRVMLADNDRLQPAYLLQLPIRLPSGEYAALEDLVELKPRRGFDVIRHTNGRLSIKVNSDINSDVTSVAEVIDDITSSGFLSDLESRYEASISLSGKREDEQQTLSDMKFGFVVMLALIFIILTWVFSSWSLPLVVMVTMPFGIVGAIFGHWIMNLTLSILSFFGVFTLAGIIVNNSIVLITFFSDLCKERPDEDPQQLIVDASCMRLRAVLITSFTTIIGLLPLVAETSTQAQFLIPMAVSISFGLMFATVLILLFAPACLSYHQSLDALLNREVRKPAGATPQITIGNP